MPGLWSETGGRSQRQPLLDSSATHLSGPAGIRALSCRRLGAAGGGACSEGAALEGLNAGGGGFWRREGVPALAAARSASAAAAASATQPAPARPRGSPGRSRSPSRSGANSKCGRGREYGPDSRAGRAAGDRPGGVSPPPLGSLRELYRRVSSAGHAPRRRREDVGGSGS